MNATSRSALLVHDSCLALSLHVSVECLLLREPCPDLISNGGSSQVLSSWQIIYSHHSLTKVCDYFVYLLIVHLPFVCLHDVQDDRNPACFSQLCPDAWYIVFLE